MLKNRFVILGLLMLLALGACVPIQAPVAEAPAGDTPVAEAEPAIVYESAADIPRVGISEAKAHYDEGTAVFVDSRSRTTFDQQHITGALPMPEVWPPVLDNSIPKDQLIITYCT